MSTIFQLQKRVARIANEAYLNKLALEQLKKLEDDIVTLNKERLSEGEDLEGNSFGTYSRRTQEIAQSGLPGISEPRKPKIAGTNYNFEWTGGLFDGMYLKVSNDYVEMWSRDDKTPLLNIEYPGIFGLQPDQLRRLIREKLYPLIMEKIRSTLEI